MSSPRRTRQVFLLLTPILIAPAMNHALAQDQGATHNESSEKSSGNSAALRTGKKSIEEALKEKCSVDFTDTSLADAVDNLKRQHRVEIQFDRPALKDAVFDPTTARIEKLKVTNVSLRSALRYVLSFWDLTMVVQDEILQITTRDKANVTVETRVYDVQDLLNRVSTGDGEQPDFDSLIVIITSTVAAANWDTVGGQGTIEPIGDGSLVILQTAEVHEQISQLFAAIRKTREQAKAGNFSEVFCEPLGPAEKAIQSKLAKRVDFTFDETPLAAVVDKIREHYGIEAQLYTYRLKDVSIDSKSTIISQQAKGITLRSALNRSLDEHDLTWLVQNEMLLITTADHAKSVLEVRLYPIGDLVSRHQGDPMGANGGTAPVPDEFSSMVSATIDPSTWSQVGGQGEIETYDIGTILIVSQSQATQEKIRELLANLREVKQHQQQIAVQSPAKAIVQEAPVLRVSELRASTPQSPMMTPDEVAEVVTAVVEPKSWSRPDTYIRGVAGKLIVRQAPERSKRSAKTAPGFGCDPDVGCVRSRC